MITNKGTRSGFSVTALTFILVLLVTLFRGWIVYSDARIQKLTELRREGAIVILRYQTPKVLQAIDVKSLDALFCTPTVELYVAPQGLSASVGKGEKLMSNADAKKKLLRQASLARNCGADDIQLILIDSFDEEWIRFASANSMSTISDSKQRYLVRLEANQKSGANVSP